VTELRELLAALAASDRAFRRFGAARHRYELAAPLADAPGAELPADYVEFVTTIGAGGAGPYYGLIPAARALARPLDGPWGRGIPIGHLGCGYAAILAGDGVWIDAHGIGVVWPIAASFTAYYLAWTTCLAENRLPEAHVPAGACALAQALGAYLGSCERDLGLTPGSIAGAALRESLGRLGPGAIEIAAEPPLFVHGDRADPCIACARLVENLGLPSSIIAAGIEPCDNHVVRAPDD
jgi:hypothetical protein